MKALLIFALLTMPVQIKNRNGTKVIAPTSLNVPVQLGTTHAKLIWRDKAGNIGGEVITNAQYAAIGGNGVPVKPASFVGTPQDWIDTWTGANGGKAYALGSRPDFNTPSKEYELGSIENRPNGFHRIYVGDPDTDGYLVVHDADILSGTLPNVTIKSKCGVVTNAAGIISGTLTKACATNGDL